MALTNQQLGQLALAIYNQWIAVSTDRADLETAFRIIAQYLNAEADKASWNVTAGTYGLPVI